MTILSWTEDYGDNNVDFDLTELKRDQCYLHINAVPDSRAFLYSKYEDCIKCPYLPTGDVIYDNKTVILDTNFPKRYRLLKEFIAESPENSIEHVVGDQYVPQNFGEFGIYQLKFTTRDSYDVEVLKEPVSIYFPILTVALIVAAIFILTRIIAYFWDFPYTKKQGVESETSGKQRVRSLDTFRGISIVLMIFVNYGHGGYPFMEHAIWNGLHVGDLVFPWFMWIMGVCIPISIKSIIKKDIPKSSAFLNILRRSCILFALGLILSSGTDLNYLRVFGVLQRFALCYLVVGSLHLFVAPNYEDASLGKWYKFFQDILAIHLQWIFMLGVVLLHSLLIFFYHPPGCPKGPYMGPGGYHDNGHYRECTGGVTGYVDRIILGNSVYQHSLITTIYKSQPFDPEGILGCLTSMFQVFLGVQAGMTMLIHKKHKPILIRWLLWGVVTGAIGGGLCRFAKEDGPIPINKNLWSLSFVLVTSSFAFLLLAACYALVDLLKIWEGKPFLFAGMNSIVLYVGHNLTYGNFPFNWSLGGEHKTHFTLLLSNVQGTSIWVLIAYLMYRKKCFISI